MRGRLLRTADAVFQTACFVFLAWAVAKALAADLAALLICAVLADAVIRGWRAAT